MKNFIVSLIIVLYFLGVILYSRNIQACDTKTIPNTQNIWVVVQKKFTLGGYGGTIFKMRVQNYQTKETEKVWTYEIFYFHTSVGDTISFADGNIKRMGLTMGF